MTLALSTRSLLSALLLATMAVSTGCVRRTVTITSEPSGAIVWLNDREVGRTPVDVDFLYYGKYDVRLAEQQSEPLMTSGRVRAPWWDTIPIDLAAELAPAELRSRNHLHYRLDERDDDPEPLLDRARALRARVPERD